MRRLLLLLFIIALISSLNCKSKREDYIFLAFGNIPIKISVYDVKANILDSIFNDIKHITLKMDTLFNKYKEYGYIYKFNNYNEPIKNQHIMNIVMIAESVRRETYDLFDIRIETLLRYYKDCEKYNRELLLDSIKYFVEEIDDTLYFDNNGYLKKNNDILRIDLGGIAKGYTAELIKEYLINKGVKKAIIDMAGDIIVFNELDNKLFDIGIRSKDKKGIYRRIKLKNGAVMTSGDYYRFYTIKNKKYNHIINPITGLDINNVSSITVIYNDASKADAYATAIMLMNDSLRNEFLNTHKDIEIFIQE